MISMRRSVALGALVFSPHALAQTSPDLLSSLISEGYSIFTALTSIAGASTARPSNPFTTSAQLTATPSSAAQTSSSSSPAASNTSPTLAASTDTLSSLLTSASVSSTPTTTQTSTTQTSPTTDTSSQTGTAAPASTSSNSGSNHDHVLAIVLGTVLGALGLGLLILLLVLCCKRRRRHGIDTPPASSISSSREALAAGKHSFVHTRPLAAGFSSRHSRPSTGHNHHGVPLMSERTNHDGLRANHLHNSEAAPFVVGNRETERSAGALPMQGEGDLGRTSHFQEHRGLNDPGSLHGGRGDRSLAAGAGGMALGAGTAAALNHFDHNRRSHEREAFDDSRVHPAYRTDPSNPSSSRPSVASTKKRSGSMPRGEINRPQDHGLNAPVGVPLPFNTGAGNPEPGVVTSREPQPGIERGQALNGNPVTHGNRSGPVRAPSVHQVVSLPSSPVQHDMEHFNPITAGSMAGAALPIAAATSQHDRPRSGSQPRPPLPPSLTIPNSNVAQERQMPNTDPHRNGTTFPQSTLAPPERLSGQSISPQTGAEYSAWDRMGDLTAADDLVSPISPEERKRSTGRAAPLTAGKPGLVGDSRSRSVSPGPTEQRRDLTPPLLQSSSPPSTSSYMTPGHPAPYNAAKSRSGLVHAVQDHFQQRASLKQSPLAQHKDTVYQAYIPFDMGRPPISADADDAHAPSRSPPKPIARKPVPHSSYNSARSTYQAIPLDEGEWRGQEELAWIHSYLGKDER